MKTVIAGSRGITSRLELNKAITTSGFDITEVISGGALGVDTLGEDWARLYEVPVTRYLPDYNIPNPKVAPLIRNAKMAEEADCAIILWDGKSTGTLNMIKNMYKLDKPVYIRMVFGD